MSVGSNNLQEMENAVTKGAAKADADAKSNRINSWSNWQC